jgi:hypothetical protein
MGTGRVGLSTKVTSGGSVFSVRRVIASRATRGRWQHKRTYGVRIKEDEFQPIDIILIQRVIVQDTNVKEPFLQVFAVHELYARRQAKLIYLL